MDVYIISQEINKTDEMVIRRFGVHALWIGSTILLINAYIMFKLLLVSLKDTGPVVFTEDSEEQELDRNNFANRTKKTLQMVEVQRFWKWNFRDRLVPHDLTDCRDLIEGEKSVATTAKSYTKSHPRKTIRDQTYIELTRNCTAFKNQRGYLTEPLSREEAYFPIAYSILFYKELQQLERLLRVIYQPQNIYCLHLDGYSSDILYIAARSLVRCFDNVFLASKREKVIYASFSRLKADINCMEAMLDKNRRWKYYINLASQDFPLKTNLEIVKILKVYNGSNDIEGITGSRVLRGRFKPSWGPVTRKPRSRPYLNKTGELKQAAPHNLSVVRGSAYGAFSRKFVDFVVHNQTAKDFLEWSRDTYSPDEHYWATLNHMMENPQLHTPGGYKGDPKKKPWLAVYAAWGRNEIDPCFSLHFIHGVCIFGIDDLPQLIGRRELFANKFHLHYQYLAMDCLEEYLWNRTVNPPVFDSYYYRRLPFINQEVLAQPTLKPKNKTKVAKKQKKKS